MHSGISVDAWKRLADLRQLRAFGLVPIEQDLQGRALIRVDDFLTPLLQLGGTLVEVCLGMSLQISTVQLTALARGLPLLNRLALGGPSVESLSPLEYAPVLQKLVLKCLTDLNGVHLSVRPLLPRLAALTTLEIFELEPPEQTAELNELLLARWPAALHGELYAKCHLSVCTMGRDIG